MRDDVVVPHSGDNSALSQNSVAIITGASSGIGRATALALAGHRLRLCLLARSAGRLAEVAAEARERGASDAFSVACDVREEAEVERAAAATLARFGRIDVLINSAGLSLNGEVDDCHRQRWGSKHD